MNTPEKPVANNRLLSLDLLRGFDLFALLVLGPLVLSFASASSLPWFTPIAEQFNHRPWDGLNAWDMVMPLFMFMAGVSIPFALSKYKENSNSINTNVYLHIFKRVAILWLLGMLCQGNLLALKIDGLYLYSNTLQAIAAGYLIASVVFLNFRLTWQIIICALLLAISWFLFNIVGGGDFTPQGNIAEIIDKTVLGRWRDGVQFSADGSDESWTFAPWYHYTWIMSSLTFGATVITGLLAGTVLRNKVLSQNRKISILAIIGASMVAVGYLWSLETPIIKTIWTPSMTLVTSGYSTLLLALFFFLFDMRKWTRGCQWLEIYGKNSILAYTLFCVVNFSSITTSILFGLDQYTGSYYPMIVVLGNCTILFFILYYLNKRGIYLKA